MVRTRVGFLIATLGLCVLAGAQPAYADKCLGTKLKAIGKKEGSLLGCQSKVAAANDTSGLGACETKASDKFSSAFAKAGSCSGTQTTCETNADMCEANVAAALTDAFPSKCESVKRKAAGKLARGELGCYSKAAAKGVPVDTAGCIPKAQDKFAAALTKAGTCPPGNSPLTIIEDNCVKPAVAVDSTGNVTDVCVCGNGTVDPGEECDPVVASCPAGQTCSSTCRCVVDPTTMTGKLLMGYQGWFSCPGDGSVVNEWRHWSTIVAPAADTVGFDFWPDTSELGADELCATQFTRPDSSPAPLYSAYNPKTVARHFGWMSDNGLDGVLLQRFLGELQDPRFLAFRNHVTENVRAAAESSGRVFAIMYDITGANAATLVTDIEADWTYLVDTLHVTASPNYLHHRNRPLLVIYGFGFTSDANSFTASQAAEVISYFKTDADARYRVTLMGGVPTYWRTLTNDSQTDPAWANVYRSFDVISPWTVGRYADETGADQYQQNLLTPDLADAAANGDDYMPVVFPGFSWHNLQANYHNATFPLNQIPRNGGHFYWRQVYDAIAAGATMIYGAMFDEVDEGTAMFKTAPTPAEMPAQGSFVPLNIDGDSLPSDWYLRLAGQAGKMLRGDIPLNSTIPITP